MPRSRREHYETLAECGAWGEEWGAMGTSLPVRGVAGDGDPIRPDVADGGGLAERPWVAAVRAGDAAAFDRLVVTYFNAMVRLAAAVLGGVDGAEDVTQDVFARIWRGRASWEVTGSLQSYLLTAVRHEAWNRLRGDRIRDRHGAALALARGGDDAIVAPSGEEGLALRADLAAVVGQLPSRRRQAIVLRYVEGLSFPEIAGVLGVSVKAAEQLVMRTLRTLRARLVQHRP